MFFFNISLRKLHTFRNSMSRPRNIWQLCSAHIENFVIRRVVYIYIEGKGKGHPRTDQEGPEGSRSIALTFSQPRRWMGWMVNATPRPLYPRQDPVTIVQEVEWTPGPLWTGEENLAHTAIRSPAWPTRSESITWLSYPDPHNIHIEDSNPCP
jgi:hypothetical protein